MMTLHVAIAKLLNRSRGAMTAAEIAVELNQNKWYVKQDETSINSNQISARVKKYPELFEINRLVSPQQIKLID